MPPVTGSEAVAGRQKSGDLFCRLGHFRAQLVEPLVGHPYGGACTAMAAPGLPDGRDRARRRSALPSIDSSSSVLQPRSRVGSMSARSPAGGVGLRGELRAACRRGLRVVGQLLVEREQGLAHRRGVQLDPRARRPSRTSAAPSTPPGRRRPRRSPSSTPRLTDSPVSRPAAEHRAHRRRGRTCAARPDRAAAPRCPAGSARGPRPASGIPRSRARGRCGARSRLSPSRLAIWTTPRALASSRNRREHGERPRIACVAPTSARAPAVGAGSRPGRIVPDDDSSLTCGSRVYGPSISAALSRRPARTALTHPPVLAIVEYTAKYESLRTTQREDTGMHCARRLRPDQDDLE